MISEAVSFTQAVVAHGTPTAIIASRPKRPVGGERFISACVISAAVWAGHFNVTELPRDKSRADRLVASEALMGGSLLTAAENRADAIMALEQTIQRYAARPEGWDGMGGVAPSASAVADALAFLTSLSELSPVPDAVYAPGDGEVMFQWRRPGAFVEVGFYGDETISWYARLAGEIPVHGDDPFERMLASHLPSGLAATLSSLA